ncbi:ketopantoate reductase family protein [Stigmatella aurantiaca]|uniref:Ketopantoate reductase PanE/ApbA family n=1 Tax=Stigmatella aurantiaca (strain DW4/3-1) TaxID=378806 RepID=Q08TL7_STIAD|nr:2-dehydropantoate 2-reductase N-terminal domain-containing protein [Stigmatella aurantiaca]ADO73128.1 Ketopantoate reductase PanE/ApbA family [Stigmatella aurantiaca DW4/3-1]EAU63840.1 ketopantoate reductase PanE/ApbA family [Stigmatella aurantiaca DW4/3-1]
MSARLRVLLVGAGAVGQVFGKFLKAAGCELSFLVKEPHVASTRAGFTLQELSRFSHALPVSLSGFGVLVSPQEVANQAWDQVWLCVSSAALHEGTWVSELARVTGEATWVMLQPGLKDRDWLSQWVPASRLVCGMIPFVSFQTPLKPGDPSGQGMAFWFPPMARGLFSGPPERLQKVIRTLRQGGYPAHEDPDVVRATAVPTALLNVFVSGLETAGWSFARFQEGPSAKAVREAAREAVQIVEGKPGKGTPGLLRPLPLKLLLLGTRLAPFDVETYVQFHFTKVSTQTRQMMGEYIALGKSMGLPVQHLEALQAAVKEAVKEAVNAPGGPATPR